VGQRGHRPDLGGGVECVTHGQRRGERAQGVDDLVVPRAGGEYPGAEVAGLPVVEQSGREQVVADLGQVEVGVVEDDRGRLAAQFQGHRAEQAAAGFRDAPARGGGAGEGDLVHVAVLDQVGAGLPAARDDVDHTRRDACVRDGLREQERVQHRFG
jgi:hypothetical protein